jgi:hypothetical protein
MSQLILQHMPASGAAVAAFITARRRAAANSLPRAAGTAKQVPRVSGRGLSCTAPATTLVTTADRPAPGYLYSPLTATTRRPQLKVCGEASKEQLPSPSSATAKEQLQKLLPTALLPQTSRCATEGTAAGLDGRRP